MTHESLEGRLPPPVAVPRPPRDPAELDPLETEWPAGKVFHRCFDVSWGARDFYPGDAAHRGRFHPFTPRGRRGPLPVLYGADDLAGALSETVFHDVPIRGARRVPYAKLVHRLAVELVCGRDLRLVDLTSHGARRLGLSRGELIDFDPRNYAVTAAWARALHDHPLRADGLTWASRQHDTRRALVLFSDRVSVDDLELADGAVPLALSAGAGLDAVCEAANRAGITVVGLPS